MKMTSRKLSDILEKRLQNDSWSFHFDREKDSLRIEDKNTGKGITLELPGIIAKWEQKKDDAIDEVVYYTEEALNAMKGQSQEMEGRESLIYPHAFFLCYVYHSIMFFIDEIISCLHRSLFILPCFRIGSSRITRYRLNDFIRLGRCFILYR